MHDHKYMSIFPDFLPNLDDYNVFPQNHVTPTDLIFSKTACTIGGSENSAICSLRLRELKDTPE